MDDATRDMLEYLAACAEADEAYMASLPLSGVTAADNETARAKPTPRVEARLIAKARGFDGDDTNTINERLNNG